MTVLLTLKDHLVRKDLGVKFASKVSLVINKIFRRRSCVHTSRIMEGLKKSKFLAIT